MPPTAPYRLGQEGVVVGMCFLAPNRRMYLKIGLEQEIEERTRRTKNITLQRTLLVCVLAGALALARALVAGVGSASAESSVVGPGESIQKAVYAADPGDTIVVRGLHHEDVAIRKNGIKLRGDDAVI
jgi:hypothetical protein